MFYGKRKLKNSVTVVFFYQQINGDCRLSMFLSHAKCYTYIYVYIQHIHVCIHIHTFSSNYRQAAL